MIISEVRLVRGRFGQYAVIDFLAVLFGYAVIGEAQGQPVVWNLGVTGNLHLFIIGTPGQGKSWTMTRLLMELQRSHVPALILDFHGQFADRTGPYVNAVHPTVLDAAAGLPFSPFECTEEDTAAE
jgi:DNA phosphorothioation-dependent restriction protein DptH